MAEAVIMPRQGQSVESCLFSEWYKKKGEAVKKGDLLFAYETDKAAFEQEALVDGILLDIFVREGDEVPVLQNIAVIGMEGESSDTYRPNNDATPAEVESADEIRETTAVEEGSVQSAAAIDQIDDSKLKASPRARNRAVKDGISLSGIVGSGPYGRIIEKDVLARSLEKPKVTPLARSIALEEKLDLPSKGTGIGGKVLAADVKQMPSITLNAEYEDKKVSNIRKIIAQNMFESLANTAQLTLHSSADARKLVSLRKRIKEKQAEGYGYNITINDLITHALLNSFLKHPEMNAHFLGNSIRYFKNIHLGFAVDTPRGLMVPTIENANHLTIEGLSSKVKELATSCQQGNIDPSLLQGASFTITNLGAFGIEMFTPVLNPPQVAILGINTISPQPADLGDGVFGFVPKIGLSLTFDHRAIDGAPAAAFLRDVCLAVENLELNL